MTAPVIDLDSRRRQPQACACPRHQLDALASRVSSLLDDTEGHLLIPRDHLSTALDDLRATTLRLLPPEERSNP